MLYDYKFIKALFILVLEKFAMEPVKMEDKCRGRKNII